jgi:hypothetical protein
MEACQGMAQITARQNALAPMGPTRQMGESTLKNIILVYESQLDFRGPNQAKMVLDRMTWLHRFDAEDQCHRVNAPR